ncbi:uncharacterized protein MYCFIDRAFT_212763 [Pseudocercospora fijiensis CIRAD86]|uniref:Uncharacterized protein n=1 Tax=Pseudocercospora fijiensis (strain CIRAD86) TaxID=383855 RepID=M2ZCI5_PSEFD|nr:uncharacterized protein MYCFIDRAFT_212763 [Pseudocercospora fijiensis CIRAD86]EME76814.1 hypothetical protein MYCFIDRAFT_212763 [Pseudocercospora fijiensis CIRAD86]
MADSSPPFYLLGPVWYGAKSHDNNSNTLHGAPKYASRHYLLKWQEVLLFKELEKFKFKNSDWLSAFKEDKLYRQTLIERMYPAQTPKTEDDIEWFEQKLEYLLKNPNASKWHTSVDLPLKYPPPPGVLDADGEEAATDARTQAPQQARRLGSEWDSGSSPSTPQPTPGPPSLERSVQRARRGVPFGLDDVASSSGHQSAGGNSPSIGEQVLNATASTGFKHSMPSPRVEVRGSAASAMARPETASEEEEQDLRQDRHSVLTGLTNLLSSLDLSEKEKAAKAKRKARMRASEEF